MKAASPLSDAKRLAPRLSAGTVCVLDASFHAVSPSSCLIMASNFRPNWFEPQANPLTFRVLGDCTECKIY